MKEILLAISFLSVELGNVKEAEINFLNQNPWLGFVPAKIDEIHKAENKLGIKLPDDYKEFLEISNGFKATNSIEPTFMKVEEIDYLRNIDKFIIEAYKLPELENSILIAGKDEEQYFLLIPPTEKHKKWKYWKFANWYPGEHEFKNLKNYFKNVLKFSKNEYQNKKK